jgi:hypothetical protein
MNRLWPGILCLLACVGGCGDAQIPTVEVGGPSGARLMNGQPKSPADAYDNAYAQLTRAHYNVHRNLEARGQNQYGAQEAMGLIVHCLEVMKSCVPDADRARFDPYLARYSAWKTDIEKGTWGGAFLTDLEQTERELKSKFNPSTTQVLAEFPGAAPAAKPETAAPKTADPLVSDKVEVPVSKKSDKPDAPQVPVEPTPPDPVVSQRLLFKTWDKAHVELVAAYKEHQDCKAKYEDVITAIRLMKEKQTPEIAGKLQIYVDYYADVEAKTKCFTALPEKTTEKDILDELEVAARVLRKLCNPDK